MAHIFKQSESVFLNNLQIRHRHAGGVRYSLLHMDRKNFTRKMEGFGNQMKKIFWLMKKGHIIFGKQNLIILSDH